MSRRAIAVGAACVLLVSSNAQPQVLVNEDALRAMTVTAVTAAKGDQAKAIAALDKAVKARWGDFQSGPIWLTPNGCLDGICAALSGPYNFYRERLITALRKMEPVEAIPFTDEATIEILPRQIGTFDIIKVVVQRNGATIEPTSDQLEPREFKNRFGAAVTLHAGSIKFPMSAFAPGANVVVTLIPSLGSENFVTKIDSKRLGKFR